jgi:solute carrier family 15 oligopeptide transporter 1
LVRALSFVGLFLIAIGTGGIKPCVAPFGAEQFKLPEQETRVIAYFYWFYAAISAGATLGSVLVPYLRSIHCLRQKFCFPLAFGVPAAFMALAIGDLIDSSAMPILTRFKVYKV